ncbi:MAG: DUF1127 domain-containing protein [Pseudomonadota bacterium]
MAAFDTNRPIATASFGGLFSIFSAAYGAFVGWYDARATRRALKALNTRQLDDIGMVSADIDLFVAKYR